MAPTISDEEILARLVQLNHERAAEERAGKVRWLRPEYQQPTAIATQVPLDTGDEATATAPVAAKQGKQSWPKSIPEQARAVRQVLAASHAAVTPGELARLFTRARARSVEELLQTLAALGHAREVEAGRYVASN